MAKLDTSDLLRAIPEIVAFGRRTLQEQCVTSAAYIIRDAQNNTAYVEVATIDSELDVQVIPRTKGGRVSRAKRPHHKEVTTLPGARVPLGVLIVMSRLDPNSEYSKRTGNRWPLSGMPTGKGSAGARREWVRARLERMTLARHSSTHYIRHGWTPGLMRLIESPLFRGRSGGVVRMRQNSISAEKLGDSVIDLAPDQVTVTVLNQVDEGSNAVLNASRHRALLEHALPQLQPSIDKETANTRALIVERLESGMKQKFTSLVI